MNNKFARGTLRSPIKEGSKIRPFGNSIKKTIAASLALTSLVDAFTILVIYLVVNAGPAETIDLKEGINLPQAMTGKELDGSPVVTFKNGSFMIENRIIAAADLKVALDQLREKSKNLFKTGEPAIVVEADENIDFNKLQPLLVASSYAGIRHVKFAVLQKD